MKQYLMCLMTMIALIAAGGCARDRNKTMVGVSETPQPLSAKSFAHEWANDLKLGGDPVSEMHLRDETVFVYTKSNTVYAVSRSGGEQKYESSPKVSGGVLRPPLVLDDRVIYPSGSTIEVFNNVGRKIRTIELEKSTRSGAIGVGNTIYLGLDHTGGTGVIASININKPYKVVNWELMTFGAVTPTPAYFDRVIFAGSEDGRLYAVGADRSAVWTLDQGVNTFNTQGRFISDIQADDSGVYASNTDCKLYCLDRDTGRIKWQFPSGVPLKTSPVVSKALVYQLVPGSGIVAIDKAAGTFNRTAKWSIANAEQVLSEDQKYVYLKRNDCQIIAVEKTSGNVIFTSKHSPFKVYATNTKDSIIYGSTDDGKISAIRPVLKEGEVGHVVMELRFEPIAMNNASDDGKWKMENRKW